jgi:cytochrome c556
MRRKLVIAVTALTLFLGFSMQVTAETSDDNAFKYRQNIMTALKGHAGAIAMQARGLAGDPSQVANHAKAMASLGSELHLLFAEGSKVEDSESLDAIWEKPEEFAAAVTAAEEAMTALGEVAESGDMKAIGAAFRDVGKSCKGCHDNFRVSHSH